MGPQAKCLRSKINKGRLFRSLDMLFLRHWSTGKKVGYQLILKFFGGEAYLHFCLHGEFSKMVFVGECKLL